MPKKPLFSRVKSYMWLYRTSGEAIHQIILYDYPPNRKAENPEGFLKDIFMWTDTMDITGYLTISPS